MTNIIKAIINYDRLKERLTLAEKHESKLRIEREKLFNEADMAQIMLAQKKAELKDLQVKYDALRQKLDEQDAKDEESNIIWMFNPIRCEWEPFARAVIPLAHQHMSPWLMIRTRPFVIRGESDEEVPV